MPSGWNVYYVVFLSAILALAIPAALGVISSIVSPRNLRAKKTLDLTWEDRRDLGNRTVLGKRMNARFFLAANAALVLITLMLALVPCAGIIQPGAPRVSVFRAVVAVVSIAAFAALGLLYAARKGDLSWLRSFQGGGETAVSGRRARDSAGVKEGAEA